MRQNKKRVNRRPFKFRKAIDVRQGHGERREPIPIVADRLTHFA
ncbi:MAG: hypothetical protein PHQ05_00940 [Sterolibacterium sp.]|nr:hypothetical protein [Sterolibacterium sp.]